MNKLDQIFNLLSKEQRRYVLYYLDQQEEPVSVDEIADQVSEWETDGVTISEEKFKQIELQLLHQDLPRVDEAKYIKYNSEEGIIELTGAPPEFEALISIAEIIERPNRNP